MDPQLDQPNFATQQRVLSSKVAGLQVPFRLGPARKLSNSPIETQQWLLLGTKYGQDLCCQRPHC